MPRLGFSLTSLGLRNFRAFDDVTVKLAPITILVGPNNAGKSSIISALRVLSQTLASLDPETSLLLEELGAYKDAVYLNDSKRSIGFNLEFQLDSKTTNLDLTYGYRVQRREVILQQFVASETDDQGGSDILFRTSFAVATGSQILRTLRGVADVTQAKIQIPFVHFLPRFSSFLVDKLSKKINPFLKKRGLQQVQAINFYKVSSEFNRIFVRLNRYLTNMQYLGPFRESPARLYPFSGERPSVLGRTGAGATDLLMSDYFRRGAKKRQLTQRVKAWLNKAQMAADLEVETLGDRHYQVRIKHPVTGESSNIADVGFGASQVLPVLVAGYEIPSDTLLMIEQPEIHLHPRAQSELGEFFVDVYKRNVQSIIETHSEHLILRLQTKVAAGEIPKEDVVVHYIEPTPTGKRIVTLTMNDDGIFTTKWPQGFFEERLTEAMNLARAPLTRQRAEKQ